MTKEKTNLIKTLKDENLRAETHKYTQNLLNNHKNRSHTVPIKNNNKNEIVNKIDNDTKIKENKIDNKINDNINTENNVINNNENDKVKKKKKIKKKIKIKKGEKIDNTEKGQKFKLLTYKSLNEIKKEEKEKKERIIEDKKEDKISNSKNKNVNKINNEKNENNKNEKDIKILKNDKIIEKSNNSRRDLLNSLSNLQYNFDNLMEIGVHGNKYLKNKK